MRVEDLRIALIELDEKRTLQLARELIDEREAAPPSILGACQNALRVLPIGPHHGGRDLQAGARVGRAGRRDDPRRDILGDGRPGDCRGRHPRHRKEHVRHFFESLWFHGDRSWRGRTPSEIPRRGRPAPPRRGWAFGTDRTRLREHEPWPSSRTARQNSAIGPRSCWVERLSTAGSASIAEPTRGARTLWRAYASASAWSLLDPLKASDRAQSAAQPAISRWSVSWSCRRPSRGPAPTEPSSSGSRRLASHRPRSTAPASLS
jgi:hypothetical protein